MRNLIMSQAPTGAIVLFVVLFLSACVTTQGVADRLALKWAGKNIDEFVIRYGAPYKQYRLNSGDIAHVWNSGTFAMSTTATTKVDGNTALTSISGGGIRTNCEMQLVTSSAGVIRQVTILKDAIGLWSTSSCYEILR